MTATTTARGQRRAPHPAAKLFSEAARRAVAEGDPFTVHYQSYRVRRSDGRDVLGALLCHDTALDVLTAGGSFAARCLGFDPGAHPVPREVRDLNDLSDRCDQGRLTTRVEVRAALLGGE